MSYHDRYDRRYPQRESRGSFHKSSNQDQQSYARRRDTREHASHKPYETRRHGDRERRDRSRSDGRSRRDRDYRDHRRGTAYGDTHHENKAFFEEYDKKVPIVDDDPAAMELRRRILNSILHKHKLVKKSFDNLSIHTRKEKAIASDVSKLQEVELNDVWFRQLCCEKINMIKNKREEISKIRSEIEKLKMEKEMSASLLSKTIALNKLNDVLKKENAELLESFSKGWVFKRATVNSLNHDVALATSKLASEASSDLRLMERVTATKYKEVSEMQALVKKASENKLAMSQKLDFSLQKASEGGAPSDIIQATMKNVTMAHLKNLRRKDEVFETHRKDLFPVVAASVQSLMAERIPMSNAKMF